MALLVLVLSSLLRCLAQHGFEPKTHADYVLMRDWRSLQHQHIWQTLDGTRAVVKEMRAIKMEKYPLQNFAGYDYSDIMQLLQGSGNTTAAPDIVGEKHARCLGTVGSWCKAWWSHAPVAWKPAVRGNKECAGNCSGVGVCNHALGTCQCPAGWVGDDCGTRFLRPCSHRYRNRQDPYGVPVHNLDNVTKEDRDWTVPGWTAARCGGYCDDTLGLCYCGRDSKYRHIPPPPGSPPGTPPIQRGRPMTNPCQPASDEKGRPTDWGRTPFIDLYGPRGWCNADSPALNYTCGCAVEGRAGQTCDQATEVFCPNQCNLRGTCELGWCKCDPGWYGTSCDMKKAGTPIEPVAEHRLQGGRMRAVWRDTPGALPAPPKPIRKRPLIYIYDLPTDYNARLLQYKLHGAACTWRGFDGANSTFPRDSVYSVETYIHDVLASSSHRTFDPEEADFFYVPTYLTCYMWPVQGWTDGPWYYAPTPNPRPMHAANFMLEVKRWVEAKLPYWKRRGGRDHVFLWPHDEGACYMPSEVYNSSIFLIHWGRLDPDHRSGSGWPPDNYSEPLTFPGYQDTDWRAMYKGHLCYTPGKDLLIPAFKHPAQYHASPLLGAPPLKRDILLYFRGDVGMWREWWYSRGIRQSLYRLAQEDRWREQYNIFIGTGQTYTGDYSTHLARSKFCLVAPGDGWSARAEDAVLHGCVPVVVMDNVAAVLEDALDWAQFSVRVPQARLHQLPQILAAINATTLLRLQQGLARVWTRFAYVSGAYVRADVRGKYAHHQHTNKAALNKVPAGHPYKPYPRFPLRQDALHTILQWLYGRIPYTLGQEPLPGEGHWTASAAAMKGGKAAQWHVYA